jgi:hypothetical protein
MLAVVIMVGAQGQEIMPLSEVTRGMIGIGKTVVAGDVISQFTIEVVGIIDEPGEEWDFIVVRASGGAITAAGGVAMGMSGSPIFIDGKLVGALSRAAVWAKSPTPIALITPIEQMLKLVGTLEGNPSQPQPEATLPGVKMIEVADLTGLIPEDPQVIYALPVRLPLVATGIRGRALELLRTGGRLGGENFAGLESMGLRFLPVSGGRVSPGEGSPLLPGGAVGAALITGDVTIGALGTLTWRRDDLILAFGHPFLFGGEVSLPLSRASVIDTIEAYDIPWKLGALGETVGAVLQDRLAGIGARLQTVPDTISVEIVVQDLDRQRVREFQVEIVRIPGVTDFLLLLMNLYAFEATLERVVGPGTIIWRSELVGEGLPRPLIQENLFTCLSDVSLAPVSAMEQLLREVRQNPFAKVELEQVRVEFAVSQEIRAIQIMNLTLDREYYSPGDVIEFAVDLQIFYGELQTVTGQLQIPAELDAFQIEVRAYAGVPLGYFPSPRSMEEFVAELEGRPTNSMLVIELVTWDIEMGPVGLTQEAALKQRKENAFVLVFDFEAMSWKNLGRGFVNGMLTLDRFEQEFPGFHIWGQATESVTLTQEFDFKLPKGY